MFYLFFVFYGLCENYKKGVLRGEKVVRQIRVCSKYLCFVKVLDLCEGICFCESIGFYD